MDMSSELSALASKLGFTLADLDLNRAGQLSAAQSWVAFREAAFNLGMMFAAVSMLLVFFAIEFPRLILGLLYLFLIPGFSLLVYFVLAPQFIGSVQRRVLSAEGSLEINHDLRGPPRIVIGKAKVEMPAGGRALVSGKRYRIFYVARTNQFLSIEPL